MPLKKPGIVKAKSLVPVGLLTYEDKYQRFQQRIPTESRMVVRMLSQGPTAPDLLVLMDAARGFADRLRVEIAEAFGAGEHFNLFRKLVSEADMTLQHELETVASFSAALLACVRYRPVRR